VIIAASLASLQVCAHAWNVSIGFGPSHLELNVSVQPLEAFVAAKLWTFWAQHPRCHAVVRT